MKKGINQWAFPASMDMTSCLKRATRFGFAGIELELIRQGENRIGLNWNRRQLLSLRKSAEKQGIALTSLCSWLLWEHPVTSNEQKRRETGEEICRRMIVIADTLGMDTVLFIPGFVGCDFPLSLRKKGGFQNTQEEDPTSEIVSYDLAYERVHAVLKRLSPLAEKHKVHLGIENVWNKFLLSPLEMRDLIDKVGSPYVRSYLDLGNVLGVGYPEHWVRILGDRIRQIHVKDHRTKVGTLLGRVGLLEGDANWPEIVRSLKEIGYAGFVTAEFFPYQFHPEALIANVSQGMDSIFGFGKGRTGS
jgi:L-ribulose-5-phosphate 3-epimerase